MIHRDEHRSLAFAGEGGRPAEPSGQYTRSFGGMDATSFDMGCK
jgi:hypothetical protein